MSVCYRAITIIGCEIDTSKLYKEVELFQDDHNCKGYRELCELGKRTAFCPDCGAEVIFRERRCTLPEYELDEDEPTIGGVEVIRALDGREFLAAYHQQNGEDGSGGASFHPQATLDSFHMAARLRTILEPLDMWDESRFGVWTILDIY